MIVLILAVIAAICWILAAFAFDLKRGDKSISLWYLGWALLLIGWIISSYPGGLK